MSGYTTLKMENISEVLKKKPRLTTCITFALAMFALTASAVGVGIFIGYTFCYIEHHTGIRTANLTRARNYRTFDITLDSDEAKGNRTINGALASSLLVSRMLHLGQALVEDELVYLPWHGKESHAVLTLS